MNPGPPISHGYVLTPIPPKRRPPALMPIVTALAALVVVAAGVGAWAVTRSASGGATTPAATATPTTPPLNLQGTLTLVAFNVDWRDVGQPCVGANANNDVRTGTRFVVNDSAGKTVAVSALTDGRIVEKYQACRFDFNVAVPAGLGFYSLGVGGHKPFELTEAEVSGTLALTLR